MSSNGASSTATALPFLMFTLEDIVSAAADNDHDIRLVICVGDQTGTASLSSAGTA